MDNTQSNTQAGQIVVSTYEDLSAKNGYLIKLAADGSKVKATLPNAMDDPSVYVVTDGGTIAENTTISPLNPNKQIRIKATGTGDAGSSVVLADPTTAANAGKIQKLPTAGGLYFSPGIAEEAFVDGQLVLIRPLPQMIRVASTDSLAALTFTEAGATGAEVEALRDEVEALLQSHGIVAAV